MLVLTEMQADRLAEQRRRGEFFWLDLAEPDERTLDTLGDLLALHPVALEDTREFGQRPKVDVYEDHLLLVFYSAQLRDGQVRPIEVHVYLTGGCVVTVRRGRCIALDDLQRDLEANPTEDAGYLVYRILDTLTDAYYPVIEGLEQAIDGIEEQVLLRARREQLTAIYRLRQDVRELLRLATTQRDQHAAMADAVRSIGSMGDDTGEYLRDIGDHLAQIVGELQRQTDDLNALTGTYFNSNADRLNVVATRLTIVGSIFVTWTVFAGFFGQNFAWLVDHVDSGPSFFLLGIGLPVVVTALAGWLMWVKRRDLF